jgi:hypothetical protein
LRVLQTLGAVKKRRLPAGGRKICMGAENMNEEKHQKGWGDLNLTISMLQDVLCEQSLNKTKFFVLTINERLHCLAAIQL